MAPLQRMIQPENSADRENESDQIKEPHMLEKRPCRDRAKLKLAPEERHGFTSWLAWRRVLRHGATLRFTSVKPCLSSGADFNAFTNENIL
ncbi:MAG: hypothetical protein A3B70_05565 [Deltaproteobacteria bacterium RIFCSPHIGHO2_02_FULL_40_11]|nr:MAG: hypothetical protein A3B70_05565 [Deltaproteobacteria bacterium RIFCSPHIGHO2_02_FULL_40_11]